MIVFTEPSILSFDIHRSHFKYQTEVDEINGFKVFIENLDKILDQLKEAKLKIPISKEFYEIMFDNIPLATYTDPRHKIARELIQIKLPKVLQVVHSYGEHNLEGNFIEQQIQNELLLELQLYFIWIDLLLISILGKYPKIILGSDLISIFKYNSVNLKTKDALARFDVYLNVGQVCLCKEYAVDALKKHIKKLPVGNIIHCSGTGDHDSMWGIKIQSISDIPLFERKLFELLFSTKLIEKVTFLSFSKKASSASKPFIQVIKVVPGNDSDIIICEIYGQGVKQNKQLLSIEVNSGYGVKLSACCENVIDEDFLIEVIKND